MFTGILAFVQTLLAGLPIVGNFLSGGFGQIIAKFFDSKTAIETARLGGAAQVAVAAEGARVSGLSVIAGSKTLLVIVCVFMVPLAAYLWKIVLWDVVIGSFEGCAGPGKHGSECVTFVTDALRADAHVWAQTIIVSIFGSLTGLTLASVFRKGG